MGVYVVCVCRGGGWGVVESLPSKLCNAYEHAWQTDGMWTTSLVSTYLKSALAINTIAKRNLQVEPRLTSHSRSDPEIPLWVEAYLSQGNGVSKALKSCTVALSDFRLFRL